MGVVVSCVLCALSGSLCVVHFVIFDELHPLVFVIGSVFRLWLPVSCFVYNLSGLSVVCCVMYCVLGCVSACVYAFCASRTGGCWVVCVF